MFYNLLWEYKEGHCDSQLFPPLLLYCDLQLLYTRTSLISSNVGHWGTTSNQLRLALDHPDPQQGKQILTCINITK